MHLGVTLGILLLGNEALIPRVKSIKTVVGGDPHRARMIDHHPAHGGKINGMILATDKILTLVDNNTKIVPGHGPLGKKADLTKFRDMLVVARDRVQKLKTAGKSAGEIAASKPFADLDATWGKGFFNGDVFAQVVYSAL